MSSDWRMELYWRLPIFLQETALSGYAAYLDRLYYGPGYAEALAEFTKLHTASRGEAAQWQDRRLRRLVRLAATQVPFYRQSWRDVDWQSVRSAADLARLPRLDKQTVRRHECRFLAEGIDYKSLWLEKTSGTTGTALCLYWPKSMLPQWWALVEVAIRKVAGVAQEMPRAMMGGRTIVPGTTKAPPYWRFNRRWRQLYLSSYHVSRASAAPYIDAMRHYRSQWITGYGSAIAALGQFGLERGLPPLTLRAAIVSGDTLVAGMRRSIEAFFGCRCYDSYGQSEAVCLAMECVRGRMHVIPGAGIVEILRADGTPCSAGEVGEIVATGLLNDTMPLVRYRMGDYAAWSEEPVCLCGNRQPMLTHLEGRLDDYLIAGDGRKIGRLSTALKRSPTIHSAQILQDSADHAYLLICPGADYEHRDAIAVRDDLLEKIGRFNFDIVEVREIPRTARGKTALVVRLSAQPELQPVYHHLLAGREAEVERAA
ncbi:MAG: phenylacetate--CoA ligase family protein [Candidatus Binatia bacterium]